jgi:hypothetical protein
MKDSRLIKIIILFFVLATIASLPAIYGLLFGVSAIDYRSYSPQVYNFILFSFYFACAFPITAIAGLILANIRHNAGYFFYPITHALIAISIIVIIFFIPQLIPRLSEEEKVALSNAREAEYVKEKNEQQEKKKELLVFKCANGNYFEASDSPESLTDNSWVYIKYYNTSNSND